MKIILISDIHIRLYKRHDEYKAVFKKTFKEIDRILEKHPDSLICLGGDIVHNKTDMTPELTQLTSDFIKECANRTETIIILGNHDFNMSNPKRLDTLTPIIDALNHKNIHFLKKSCVKTIKEITFSVFSILDGADNWKYANQIKGKTKIALFHGPVITENSSNNYMIESTRAISINKFDGFDIVLLGDIHNHYFLNDAGTIAYPGSLIQQDHSESIDGHGILVWDVETKTAEHIEINNDYAYYTINVVNNLYTLPNKKLPKKKIRLRIKHENSSNDVIQDAIKKFGEKYEIVELRQEKNKNTVISRESKIKFGDSRKISYQNILISEFFKNNKNVSESDLEKLYKLNTDINNYLFSSTQVNRNILWTPIKLSFSNMFSYGENNEIDFTDFNGIYGINAPNFAGKSSLLDILCFVLYDKTTRTSKGNQIINYSKNTFECNFSFQYHEKIYNIKRRGTKNKNGAVRVDVDFWYEDEKGNVISLNGEDRDGTNKNIREYVGIYDDFVMTAFSSQYDNRSFVEKTQSDRKELLYQFLDISIYESLFKRAKELTKETTVLLKDYERKNLYKSISEINSKINYYNNMLSELNVIISNIDSEMVRTDLEIQKNRAEIINVNCNTSKEILLSEKNNILSKIEKIRKELLEKKLLIDRLSGNIEPNITYTDISHIESEIDTNELEYKKIQKKINEYKLELAHCIAQSDSLKSHEYDPNCQYCCNNKLVISATDAMKKIPNLTDEIEKCKTQISFFENIINSLNKSKSDIDTKNAIHHKNVKILSEIEKINNEISYLSNTQLAYDELFNKNSKDIIEFETNENIILKNSELEKEILEKNKLLNSLKLTLNKEITEYNNIKSKLSAFNKELEVYNKDLSKYTDLLASVNLYELYCDAMGRNSIPYMIMEKILPVIEQEVNELLIDIAPFSVKLYNTDDRYILADINYGNGKTWAVELTSGMERFIISLAFRIALTELTPLPKPTFLAIDEGFGVLDAENILSMSKLFDYLKTKYQFILVISHIDSMKDLSDNNIFIERTNGYSRIII